MDSLTQALLGAAVGEAALGRRAGWRAPVWGAVLGTLPDLDVLWPYADAVSAFTWHRGPTHSLFVLAAVTPLVVWLIRKLHPSVAAERRGWYALVLLVFGTHVLLDCFTIYGTQALWPLPVAPVGWGTVFIIDPLVTVPLAAGLLGALVLRRRCPARAARWNQTGLALATVYLAWGAFAKVHVEAEVREALARQEVAYERLDVLPTPFNTLVWRVLGMTPDGYFEGFYSLTSPPHRLALSYHPDRRELLAQLAGVPAVERLAWFTKGFHRVRLEGADLILTDLRMGAEPAYAFNFRIAEAGNPHLHPVVPRRVQTRRDLGEALREVRQRL
jgi:inner membrane protein